MFGANIIYIIFFSLEQNIYEKKLKFPKIHD